MWFALVLFVSLTASSATTSFAIDEFAEGSASRESHKIYGNMAAAFTPVNKDFELDFTNVPKMAMRLKEWGIPNVMLGGTTGESVSFSTEERVAEVKAWMPIADRLGLNVYVHVGENAQYEARELAARVSKMGIKGFLSMGPTYFKPSTADELVDTIALIASGAPDLPFWYYHFPANTGLTVNMLDFIRAADSSGKIPNLMGIKYTDEHIMEFNEIGNLKNKKYNMLMGRDEILTSALTTGVCDGGVGSTLNFISYNVPLRDLYMRGDAKSREIANQHELQTIAVIQAWKDICGSLNPQKAILKMTGIDFGPLRLPQANLSHDMEM